MREITLGNAKTLKTLKVNIGDKTYSVPLAGSLTLSEVQQLSEKEEGYTFFEKYIPRKVLESLTVDDMKALTAAWKEASADDSQPDVGE